jgi:hypothetical protein
VPGFTWQKDMDALVHHQVVSQVELLRSKHCSRAKSQSYNYDAVLSLLNLFVFYYLQVITTVMVHEAHLIETWH